MPARTLTIKHSSPAAIANCIPKPPACISRERGFENGNPFPKSKGNDWMTNGPIQPLKGSIHLEWKRCGRPNCRCAEGHLHGPYFYRRWRDHGRLRKAYVPRWEVHSAIMAVALRRNTQKAIRAVRTSILALERRGRAP